MIRIFRGRDHIWHLVKYKADIAIYAKCKCGWHFPCKVQKPIAKVLYGVDDDVENYYSYCPACGARKLWKSNDIKQIDKFAWEDN